MDKPLVLVQEADPDKGGGTIQALRAECPEDLQPDIFDKDWPFTIWYRIDEFQLISLKIIAEAPPATASRYAVLSASQPRHPLEPQAVLLCSPNYLDQTSLPLCVSGEPESQSFAFSKQTTLWASPANAGAMELANELAAAFAGLTVFTTDDRPATVTHMLLYLNEHSFVSDERLAEQVKQARENKLKIVMAHENDPDKGGCQFSRFFEVTPQERMSHIDVRPEPPLPPQPSPPNATGAHRRRTLQGPGNLVLPRAPPHGACPISPAENSVRASSFMTGGVLVCRCRSCSSQSA